MLKKVLLILLIVICQSGKTQSIKISGNVKDTATKQGLPNALLMALKFNDSSLVNYSKSNAEGFFKPMRLPIDTYLVILSHSSFGDKTFLLVSTPKDTVFNIKNCILPPKSVTLNEVEILAGKEKSYYKGDTLIFTADSFKTRPNASVEDLLKKLPGVKVDAAGKITVQGKQVDQVLVDGDEFFGSDPTIATRNINAASVDNVQVYDKKNENTDDGKGETLKVVNLKMKEDAKKGYFGKVAGATDFQKFYENELLFNKFKGSRKVSVFGLAANTPKQGFNWEDSNKYGLSQENGYTYDEENNMWYGTGGNDRNGIPQSLKGGFYYSDHYGKNNKLNMDYTFNRFQFNSGTETNTQYFLTDTTFSNARVSSNNNINQSHTFNGRIFQKLDSLTELTIAPKVKYNTSENTSTQQDKFIASDNTLTRNTGITNSSKTNSSNLNVQIRLTRNFKKKDRSLTLNYQPVYDESYNNTSFRTTSNYFLNQEANKITSQKKDNQTFKMEHSASATYIEPLSKKFKTELSYNFTNNQSINNRKTLDSTGTGFDFYNPLLSNNFINTRIVNRVSAKLIYDVKKFRVSVGTAYRNIFQQNHNVNTNVKLPLTVNNVLPNASFSYRPKQSSQLTLSYSSSSQQPEIRQMQPVIDNSDPNRISLGNPALKPTFSNNLNLNYYFFKGISDINFWSGANFGNTNNQISNTTTYDSQGRAITQPVNINGNYYGSFYLGGGFPVFKRFMKITYGLNGNHNNNVSLVNNIKNISQNTGIGPRLGFEKSKEKYEVSIGGNYHYNVPKTNISQQSTQPYYTYGLEGNLMIKFPKKITFTADAEYTNNGNRTVGYNLNYVIVNSSLAKTFLKSENLVVSVNANDILNQNISNNRYISNNQIVDTKTQIIKRYFLFRVLYKINSQKTKTEEDD